MPPPLDLYRHETFSVSLTPAGLRIDPLRSSVLAEQSRRAGGTLSYLLVRPDRLFDALVVPAADAHAWLVLKGRMHDVSGGDEDGVTKWIGPIPIDAATDARAAVQRALGLPRPIEKLDSDALLALHPGARWVETIGLWENGPPAAANFERIRVVMPRGELAPPWHGRRLRVRGCLEVPAPRVDLRIPMTRGYSGPVLWATDCELAASETAPSQRRPVAQKRGAAPRRSRAYFPPSPDVLQAGSSGALADGEPDRLYDPALFGTAGDRWAHLVLAEPLIHPWLRYFVATILDLPAEDLWNVSRGFLKLAVTCHDADGRRVLSAVRCLTLAEADASSSPDRAWIQESLGRFMIDFGPSIVLDEIAKRGGARGLAAVELAKARTPLADQVLRVLPLPPPVLRSAPLRASETSATSILARVTHLNARLARLRALAAPSTIVLKDLSYLGEAVDDWLTYGVVLQAHESGLLENLPGALAADLATFTREPPPFPHRPRSTRAPEDADIWANRIGATRRLIEHAVSAADRDPPVWLLRSLALEPAGP